MEKQDLLEKLSLAANIRVRGHIRTGPGGKSVVVKSYMRSPIRVIMDYISEAKRAGHSDVIDEDDLRVTIQRESGRAATRQEMAQGKRIAAKQGLRIGKRDRFADTTKSRIEKQAAQARLDADAAANIDNGENEGKVLPDGRVVRNGLATVDKASIPAADTLKPGTKMTVEGLGGEPVSITKRADGVWEDQFGEEYTDEDIDTTIAAPHSGEVLSFEKIPPKAKQGPSVEAVWDLYNSWDQKGRSIPEFEGIDPILDITSYMSREVNDYDESGDVRVLQRSVDKLRAASKKSADSAREFVRGSTPRSYYARRAEAQSWAADRLSDFINGRNEKAVPRRLDPKGDILAQYKSGQGMFDSKGMDDYGLEAVSLMTDEELADAIAYKQKEKEDGTGMSSDADLRILLAEKAKREAAKAPSMRAQELMDVTGLGQAEAELILDAIDEEDPMSRGDMEALVDDLVNVKGALDIKPSLQKLIVDAWQKSGTIAAGTGRYAYMSAAVSPYSDSLPEQDGVVALSAEEQSEADRLTAMAQQLYGR